MGCEKNCSGHGACTEEVEGALVCNCDDGCTGEACAEELKCPVGVNGKDCSGNGVCHLGRCFCEHGFRHASGGLLACEQEIPIVALPPEECINDCNGNGLCHPTLKICLCDLEWRGIACSKPIANKPLVLPNVGQMDCLPRPKRLAETFCQRQNFTGQDMADCMKAECECPSVWKKMAESCQLLLAEEDQLECREDVCSTGDSTWVRAAYQANQATFQQLVALEKKEKVDELL